MIRLNYILTIPVVCILLESIHIINLVAILVYPEYIWVFNVLYSGVNIDAIHPIDILLNLNIAVSIIVQLLFIFWYSIDDFDEKYAGNIGYLWIILGYLFLANILLLAAISEWYTLPLKSSPSLDSCLVLLSSIIVQATTFLSSLFIGILMVISENRSSKVKKVKFSRKLFKE